MGRKDALLKLYDRLHTRRNELLRSIRDDFDEIGNEPLRGPAADDLDAAVDSVSSDISSQLAEIESRELAQVERAMSRLRDGLYGSCESCGKRIPVARLNALPYTTLCIECQRDLELNPNMGDELSTGWQKVYDAEAATRDVNVNLSDLEYGMT